jgi:hypothetical protein
MLEKYLVNEGIDVQVYTNRQALAVNSVGEIVDEKSPLEIKLKKMQREDEYLKEIYNLALKNKKKGYMIEDGVLLKIRKENTEESSNR